MPLYDSSFMKRRKAKHRDWQIRCGWELTRFLNCRIVVDFGCGIGAWLEGVLEAGGIEVRGYEIAWMQAQAHGHERVARCICHGDLAAEIKLERRYDLAICVEVMEHLPGDSALQGVRNLVRASDCIFFSAARPGQRGTGHVNCQPKGYWLDLFAEFGYRHSEAESAELLAVLATVGAADWVTRNGMVIRKSSAANPKPSKTHFQAVTP